MNSAAAFSTDVLTAWKAELRAECASARRPASRVIADLFVEIDHAIRSGVSRARVLELLAERGLRVTLALLDKCLYRLRKRRRDEGVQAPPVASTTDSESASRSLIFKANRDATPVAEQRTLRPSLLLRAQAFAGAQTTVSNPAHASATAAVAPDRRPYRHLTEAEAARRIDDARLRQRLGKA